MHKSWAKQNGFTIVELLIVIVVIGVLAAITIVAYNGIQQRARDNRRTNDSVSIRKALELYKIDNGTYPMGGYYESTDANWTTFSNILKPYTGRDLPKDPINDTSHFWRYIGASGTSYSCSDGSKGDFYVLWFIGYEQPGNIPSSSQSFTCPGAGWGSGGIYGVWQAWQK
jgi:prepilin-type N-terminal cleavage/methylation domain-containing protein